MKLRGLVLIGVGAVLMAGCSSGSKAGTAPTTTTTSAPSTVAATTKAAAVKPKTYFNEDAGHLAALAGCTGVSQLPSGDSYAKGLRGDVMCTLEGYAISIQSWDNGPDAAVGVNDFLQLSGGTYFAIGTGYTAFAIVDHDTRGEKEAAAAIVAKLGGKVAPT